MHDGAEIEREREIDSERNIAETTGVVINNDVKIENVRVEN